MYHDFSLILAILFYLSATVTLAVSISRQALVWRTVSVICAFAGGTAHSIAQLQHWHLFAVPDVGLLNLLSLCVLVGVFILCISVFSKNSLYDASLVALPLAAVVLILEWAIPMRSFLLTDVSAGTTVHIISSVLAFGVFTIAGVYALFIALIDYFLRRHHLNPWVRTLPPLETLERLLFQLIGIGFILLTVSLISGTAFVSDLFAQHLVHKTILSLLAWIIFGFLLLGRWRYGWRGRYAVKLTLAGLFILVLSYFGSKIVLELILDRSWRG